MTVSAAPYVIVRRVERAPDGELDPTAWPATLPSVAAHWGSLLQSPERYLRHLT